MKVVLLKDVKDMGRAGTAHEVSDGHAINFLIPRGMAAPATAQALKQAELRKKQADDRKALDMKLVAERLEALAGSPIVIRKKVNEKGHLYDAVDAREIASAAALPEEVIRIERPFKEAGTVSVSVAYGDQFGEFPLTIEAE